MHVIVGVDDRAGDSRTKLGFVTHKPRPNFSILLSYLSNYYTEVFVVRLHVISWIKSPDAEDDPRSQTKYYETHFIFSGLALVK